MAIKRWRVLIQQYTIGASSFGVETTDRDMIKVGWITPDDKHVFIGIAERVVNVPISIIMFVAHEAKGLFSLLDLFG